MTTYQTELVVNPRFNQDAVYGPAQQTLLNREAFADVKTEVTAWPEYEPTPLIPLTGLAETSGIAALWCKYEGARFAVGSFKPTGPTYAMLAVLRSEVHKATGAPNVTTQDLLERRYESITRDITVSAATSGNHGRALAWGAQQFGCRCVVYMNEGVSAGREAAIAAYGAEVVRVPGSFDEAVLRCFADAESLGYFPIADHELGTYKDVPRRITQGYALVADEVVTELRGHAPPTHVFVPGGSGKLASAICGHLWEQYEYDRPRVITVEPVASACLVQSARAGKAIEISGEAQTVMDGLVVGQASAQAWEILGDGAFAFMAVEDQAAIDAMRQASKGAGEDTAIAIGDTGSAGWAGFLASTRDADLRRQLHLDKDSRVVLVVTEGATDPEVYRDIVGTYPEEV